MSDGIRWDYDAAQSRFVYELQRVMATSRRTSREVVKRNFKGVLRLVFAVTPPMGGRRGSIRIGQDGQPTGRVDFAAGKKQGQNAILADLARAFQPIPARYRATAARPGGWEQIARIFGARVTREVLEQSPEQLLQWYKSKRNNKRRIRGRPRLPAWTTSIAYVRRKLLAEQGLTASGWLAGANRFGVGGLPKWITRHNNRVPGAVEIRDTETELKYLVKNNTDHTDSGNIQQKLSVALTMQANAMARSTADFLNRQRIR